ncbi:RNI-like protein [Aspergillus taichungensis]|uniref:RNI-like protein n=1 Tax=Aspergillus taichungensis TaxID=482145 RepID=A0A2J5HMF0_9EURO|nr:RNI-like protein [Aspergillus taichungensis]
MADRRQTRNQIRGPQSALTDFLASNNISAAQISEDYQRRVREAERTAVADQATNSTEQNDPEGTSESPEQRKKRKRKETAALAKIKQSKEFARRKSRRTGEPGDDDDSMARDILSEQSRPMPGQLENCEICSKRFTVTPYSKTGPNGGLLCAKCSKDQANDDKKPKVKKAGPRIGRRQNQSNLLDGNAQQGASTLVESCIRKVADNINDIEEFGDLPSSLLHRLSQILSKRRALTPRTLNLFLRRELRSIDIYDTAKLETDDFQKIFTFMPDLNNVNLRFASQLKDRVLDYTMDRELKIEHLQIDSANLVSDTCWQRLLVKLGPDLKTLKLSNLDTSFNDETVGVMSRCCPGLRRLKLKQCWKMGDGSLQALGLLPSLEHLSLDFIQETDVEKLLDTIGQVGPRLRTLSLEGFPTADDRILEGIHNHCQHLTKLRFTSNSNCTDRIFSKLFTDWSNPALEFVDLSSTRDVDNANADGPADAIGLASQGFVALMNHSGRALQKLNISSCRHISREAFEEAFADDRVYPKLRELDVSFHTIMDDYLIGRIFRCCPSLTKLIAFACFNVQEARVPVGVALIGGLKAQDRIVVEGDQP